MKSLSIFCVLIFVFHLSAMEELPAVDLESGESSFPINTNKSIPVHTVEEGITDSETEVETEEVSEEEALMQFLVEEVLPAFGGFQDILFSNKPSFDIHWTPKGMQIKHCSFKFQLQQLRTIQYNLADIELYGFQSNAEIGGSRFLFVQVSCGETNNIENKKHFKIKFFVTDEEQNPSFYSLKIKTMDKEQFDIKLVSIQMDVDIETVDYTLISDNYGHIEILPNDSPFLQFFEEDKAYVEVVDDEEDGSGVEESKEAPIKNMYDINLSIWNQIKGITEAQSNESFLVPLKKVRVEQVITLKGSAELFLPVYKDGVKEDAPVVIPITGNIFSSVDGEMMPVIDISTN